MKYKEFIKETKFQKKADVLLCIPTMNSAPVTTKTLQFILKNNTKLNYDVLIIDNGSTDYKELVDQFPTINFIVTTKNTGSSGAQRLGIEIAIDNKYEYVICTDNDALLLTKDGLSLMYQYLSKNQEVGCVAPQHTDFPISGDKLWDRQLPLHYLFIRTSVFNKFEPHNFYHFLMTDDIALTSKIVTKSKLIVMEKALYYHPTFKPSFLANKCFFYYVRGFLIVLFVEKDIALKLKVRHLLHLLFKICMCTNYAILLKDVTYLTTVRLAVTNFVTDYKDNWASQVPNNKTELVEVKDKPISTSNFSKMGIISSFLPKKGYYVITEGGNKTVYYKRIVS